MPEQATLRGAAANQRALQEAIKKLIVERGLRPGDALPTEAELMAALSVSRHPLREAIKALQALGIVDIHHGMGTYVGTLSFSPLEAGLTFHTNLSLRGDLRDIRNLVEVREVLETGLVRQVLALSGDADFDTLDAAVVTMEVNAKQGEYSPDADWLFHKTLYKPLSNDLVSDLLRVFWTVFDKVNSQLPRENDSPRTMARWHRNILVALERGDEATMTAAMDEHFSGIRDRVERAVRR